WVWTKNGRSSVLLAGRIGSGGAGGGAVLATGRSGLARDGRSFNLPIDATLGEPIDFDPSYMTTDGLDPALPDAPIVMYALPLSLEPGNTEVLAYIRPSYFNRSWDRFCSHLHTPENPTAPSIGPAILRAGSVIHCAFPLFRLYGETGQVNYKYVLRNLIERLAPDPLMGTDLPSAARMSLIRQAEENRDVLHLLYAPTQLRGAGMALNDGRIRPVEIIEDAPLLKDATAWVRRPAAPLDVVSAYSGAPLEWDYDPDRERLTITFPALHIHEAAVITPGQAA
ncbi:MAG: beta-galactosidase, partial [Geminicoccaceae bacterium]